MAELKRVKSSMFAILKEKGPLSLHEFVTEFEKRNGARMPFLQFDCKSPIRFVYFLKDLLKVVDGKVLLVSEDPPADADDREDSVLAATANRIDTKTRGRVETPRRLKEGIPPEIERNFERLAKRNPDGIYEEDFFPMYEKLNGFAVDHTEFGFDSAFRMLLSCRSIVIERIDKRFVVYPKIVPQRALSPPSEHHPIPLLGLEALSSLWKDSFANFECDPTFKFTPPQVPEDWALVEIIDAYSPTEFWIRTKNNADRQNNLMDKLNEYYVEKEHLHDLQDFVWPGMAVVGFFLNEWHRAEIKSITDNRMELFFVDYGTTVSKVKRYHVKKLHKEFAKDEMLALKATMWNVQPPNGISEWSMDAHNYVYQEWGYITVRMKIIKVNTEIPQVEAIFFSDKSSKYKNYFTTWYPDKIFNLNELLVKEKLGAWIVSPDPDKLNQYLASAMFHHIVKSRSALEPLVAIGSANEMTNKPVETRATKQIDEPKVEILASSAFDKSSSKPLDQILEDPFQRFDEKSPQPTAMHSEKIPVDMTVPGPQPKNPKNQETSDSIEPLTDLKGSQKEDATTQVTSTPVEPIETEPELIGIFYESINIGMSAPGPRPIGVTTQETSNLLEPTADLANPRKENDRPQITSALKPEADPSKHTDEYLPLPAMFCEKISLDLSAPRPRKKGDKNLLSSPLSSEKSYTSARSLKDRMMEQQNLTDRELMDRFGVMEKKAISCTAAFPKTTTQMLVAMKDSSS